MNSIPHDLMHAHQLLELTGFGCRSFERSCKELDETIIPLFTHSGFKVADFEFQKIGPSESRVLPLKTYFFSRRVATAYDEGEIRLSDKLDPWNVLKKAIGKQHQKKPLAQYRENRCRYFKMEPIEDGNGGLRVVFFCAFSTFLKVFLQDDGKEIVCTD